MKNTNYLKEELYELIKSDESIFDFIQESSLDGLWYWDLEQPEEEWMNPKFWAVLGYDHREMPHKASAWQDIIHPKDLEIAKDNVTKHLENPDFPYDQVARYTHKNGSTVWIRCRGLAVRDEHGKPLRMLGAHQEITELKNNELLLKSKTAQLHNAQQISKVGSWELDLKTNEMVWTEELYKMYGFDHTLPPPPYSEHMKLLTSESWANLMSCLTLTREQGIPYELELRSIRKDGSQGWMWARGEAVFDENKRIIGLRGVAQDITEKKILELEKEALIKRLNYALDASGDGIWDWTPADGITVFSKAWVEMLGYEVGELAYIASEWSDRLHPDDSEWVFAAINKVTQTPENGDTFSHEYRFRNKAGDYLWIHNRAKVVERNEKGEASRVVGTHTNITEQKRKEAEIAAISKEIKDITIAVNEATALSITNAQGIFVKVNKKLCEICGYTEEELIGQNHNILNTDYHDASFWRNQWETIMAGKTWKGEIKKRKKDGSDYWVNTVIQPIYDDLGQVVQFLSIRQDITDRKKTELVLQDSELRLSLATQAGGVGVWDLDIVANKLTWDDQMFALYGVKREEFSSALDAWTQGVYEADREQGYKEFELAIKGEKEFNTEFRVQTPNGQIRNIRALAKILRDKDGNATRMIGTNWDITNEKEALRQIEEANQKLKSIFYGMQDVIWAIEAETFKTIFITPSAEDFYGYTLDEWYSNSQLWSEVIVDEYKNIIPQMFKNLEEEGFSQSEYKIRTKSGALKWVKNRVKVVKENGVVARFEGVVIDITKEKEALRQLEEAKEQAEASEGRLIIAQGVTKVGSWETDLQTFEVVWSEETYKIFGTDNLRFQASHPAFLEFVHPEDKEKVDKAFLESLTKAGINMVEHRILTVDNIVKHVEERWQIHSDLNGKPTRAVGTCQDITERKQAEQELIKAKEQAEAANKAKSEFLANMSHEIRTPLNGVIGFTELLTKTPLSPVQQQYANSANVSGHTLLGIINDILDFSKIEAGMLELEVMKTDMVELLENSIDIVKFSAADKTLELLLDIDPSMPRFAHVDAIRTKQILANLLSNAVKFTEKGEVALQAVYHTLEGKQGKLSISVRDTGIGITEEQKAKLFKSFSQADSSTTRKYGGTGLGLVISQMIAEKMGSTINLDSTPGVGTTFSFDIITDFEQGEKPNTAKISGVNRCLIIDDNDNNRLILDQMLKQWHIKSDSCNNGLEALKKLQSTPPYDMIICDYDMPYLNGIDTIRLMKDKLELSIEKQPIILLHSSIDDTDLNQKSKELGIRFHLNKPVKSQDLFNYLSDLDQTSETIPQKETEQPVNTSQTRGKIKVLIAEDNPLNMELSKIILSQLMPNSEVYEAKNGLEAIEQYKSISPDLIFMDVHMPELDGIDATKKIRKLEVNKSNHLPIIALTAGALKEEKEKCIAAGMDDFLTKPLESKNIQTVFTKFFPKGKKINVELQNIDDAKNDIHFGFSELTRSVGNNMETAQKLISMFITDMPTKIDQLEQACKDIDLANVKAIAHSINGTSLHMRCSLLAEIARKMDNATEDHSFEHLEVLLTALKEEWETVKHLLLQKIDG
ncbi:MAG: PAS domain-containing protein [Cyclobacteriaceae bacterium]